MADSDVLTEFHTLLQIKPCNTVSRNGKKHKCSSYTNPLKHGQGRFYCTMYTFTSVNLADNSYTYTQSSVFSLFDSATFT